MHIGLQIPSFKYPGGTAAIRPKLKEIVTTAEEAVFTACGSWTITIKSRDCLAKPIPTR